MAINTIKVKAQNRTELGSRAMKRIRDKGMVPAVIYGHKQAVLPITLDKKEVSTHINKGAHLFDLDVAGTSETVLVKEAQYDHLGIQLLHVDFSRVSLDERVKVKVPLELKGTPKGEAEGGKLQQMIAELDVECVVVSIPDVIRHVVTDMEMDSVLHIKDLHLPEGVKSLQDPDLIVAMVREVKEEAVAAAEVAVPEPEVIGAKEREEKTAAEGTAAPAKGEAKK